MFWYFGYGSNLDAVSLRAKGVHPTTSCPAELTGWRLRFNVAHFFAHEGGVANIERTADPGDRVLGMAYHCPDEALEALDLAEAYPYGYDRVTVRVQSLGGALDAIAYVGTVAFVDDSCRPSQRYLNIVVRGAEAAGLDERYVAELRQQPTHVHTAAAPFVAPDGRNERFDLESLAARPECTGLAGAVFDMTEARVQHAFLRTAFGGKDMTLFHLRRMDSSDGTETMRDVTDGRLSAAQRAYLDEYLVAYALEYHYVGTIAYG